MGANGFPRGVPCGGVGGPVGPAGFIPCSVFGPLEGTGGGPLEGSGGGPLEGRGGGPALGGFMIK